jgi:chaperonin GroEL (HSP60 family)
VINLMADMLIARYRWGSFALEATEDLTDESSAKDRQKTGLAAYAKALDKLQRALAGS